MLSQSNWSCNLAVDIYRKKEVEVLRKTYIE